MLVPTWREAWADIWETVTGVRGGSVRQALVLLLLALGSGWVVYQCLELVREERPSPSMEHGRAVEAEKKRLRAVTRRARSVSALRTGGAAWAASMRAMGKRIFEAPVEAPVEPPPRIVVRAVMLAGKERVAVADIAGGGNGVILHAGDGFLNGKGRVLRISEGGIVVRWGGRDWPIDLWEKR